MAVEMETVGHRGAMGYEDENTLASFKKAIEMGVDMIEYDVYSLATDDSVPYEESIVVMHDDTVERTTDGTGNITDYTPETIRNLRTKNGHAIPTLKEVLELVDKRAVDNKRTKQDIELKGRGTARKVAKVIEKYVGEKGWRYDDFVISSIDHEQLKIFHQALPQVPIGALFDGPPIQDAMERSKTLGATFVGPSLEFVTREFITLAHQNEMKCFVYTVNEPPDIERMRKWGADAIFSNYPDRVKVPRPRNPHIAS